MGRDDHAPGDCQRQRCRRFRRLRIALVFFLSIGFHVLLAHTTIQKVDLFVWWFLWSNHSVEAFSLGTKRRHPGNPRRQSCHCHRRHTVGIVFMKSERKDQGYNRYGSRAKKTKYESHRMSPDEGTAAPGQSLGKRPRIATTRQPNKRRRNQRTVTQTSPSATLLSKVCMLRSPTNTSLLANWIVDHEYAPTNQTVHATNDSKLPVNPRDEPVLTTNESMYLKFWETIPDLTRREKSALLRHFARQARSAQDVDRVELACIPRLVRHIVNDKPESTKADKTRPPESWKIDSDGEALYLYTTAISVLASTHSIENKVTATRNANMALDVFEEMEDRGICPSSYTLAAVFRAIESSGGRLDTNSDVVETVCRWRERFETVYPDVPWTAQVFEAAVSACSCDTTSSSIPDNAFSEIKCLLKKMQQSHILPTTRVIHSIFRFCHEQENANMAMSFLDDVLAVSIRNKTRSFGESPLTVLTPKLWYSALQVCSVSGDWQTACSMLQKMAACGFSPNVRHWTALLVALYKAKETYIAVWVMNYLMTDEASQQPFNFKPSMKIDLTGVPPASPDLIALKTVLRACADASPHVNSTSVYDLGRELLNKAKTGAFGFYPDEQCYNLLLSTCEDPDEAKGVVHEMRLSQRHRVGAVPPTLYTYTQAISVCRKVGDTTTAQYLIQRARDDGLIPDVYMYSAVIWTAAQTGDVKFARVWFEDMKANECEPNTVTYNGLIATMLRCRMVHEAVSMYSELMQKGLSPLPSTFVLLGRAIRTIKDADEKLVLLARIFDLMGPNEWKTSVGGPVIEALISTYGALGMYEDARRVFESIEGPCDAACLRAVLFACSQASPVPEWEEALSLLHSSDIVSGCEGPSFVDPIALSNTMLACSKADQWKESMNLLTLYADSKTSPLAFNSLIAACGRSGRPDMSMEVLNLMPDYGVKPDERSYRNAIIACNQAEHVIHRSRRLYRREFWDNGGSMMEWWECAVSLIRKMREAGIQPSAQAYSSAISACEAAGQWQRALGVLQTMMDDSLEGDVDSFPNLYCFNAAIGACAKGGAWVEAVEVYERLVTHGHRHLQPNIVTLGSLTEALDSAGQKELAQAFYEEGVRRNIVNPWRTTSDRGGTRVRAMDLHTHSAAMARAAIRSHLEMLHRNNQFPPKERWIIIVGKGLRSEEEPVLASAVLSALSEFSLQGRQDEINPGRIIVQVGSD